MDPFETQKLVEKSNPKRSSKQDHNSTTTNTASDGDNSPRKRPSANVIVARAVSLLVEPFEWLQMLSKKLNPTFIFGIVIVYGLSQGFSGSYFKVVTDYYWKDYQKVQPSMVQIYLGLYYIPWVIKPVWGLFTDCFPIRGYRRRPYFVVAGVVAGASSLLISLLRGLSVSVALSFLIGVSAGLAIAEVTIDACTAKNSIEFRSLAPDIQSLCGVCSSIGALVGYSSSGFFVHHLGPRVALVVLAISPALVMLLGFVIHEEKCTSNPTTLQCDEKKGGEELKVALKGMWETFKCSQVWKPSLYMYLSLALSISTGEGQFYWYTDPQAGPAFSQEFVGVVRAIGAMASIVGVLIYQKTLKNLPFRQVLFLAQLLYAVTGMLDVVFIRRWNVILGIPDAFFVISEECVSHVVSRIRWMPMIVLSTRLCPTGIEGTFFALLTCIDSLGLLSSKWGGGAILHTFHVTRNDFTNLWLVIMIRNILRFATLGLIFLIPKYDQPDQLIPSNFLMAKSAVATEDVDDDDDDGLELIRVNESVETV